MPLCPRDCPRCEYLQRVRTEGTRQGTFLCALPLLEVADLLGNRRQSARMHRRISSPGNKRFHRHGPESVSVARIILAETTFIKPTLLTDLAKPADNCRSIKIQLSVQVAPADNGPQPLIGASRTRWLIIHLKILLVAKGGVSISDESG